MTNPYRAMCAELAEELHEHTCLYEGHESELVARARALLAQPESQSLPANYIDPDHTGQDREVLEIFYTACQSEGGTADEIHLRGIRAVLAARALLDQPVAEGPMDADLHRMAFSYSQPCFDFEYIPFARAVLDRWGRPTPQPEEGDIHYAWELHDAEGDWQAGGSANSLEDVQREGNHYLQTYSQDRPHKLIIQRHCVSTIEFDHHDFY